MRPTETAPGGQDTRWTRWPQASRFALAVLAAVIVLQVELAFSKSINWDEFVHFSEIHRHLQGRPMPWLQIPYVWLFSWVPSLPGDGITHIQLIRLLLLPFELLTILAIMAAARILATRDESILAGLLYATGGYVFLHAFSLRGDIIAAGLLTVALWICLCRPLRLPELLAAGVLVALAFVATIKSALYAPAFLGAMIFRIRKPAHAWALLVTALLLAAATVLLLIAAPSLPNTGPAGILRAIGTLGRGSLDRMFGAGFLPQSQWLYGEVTRAPLLALAVLTALALVLAPGQRALRERLLLLALLLPLGTVLFYRNAFPYHYAFILPPAMIAAAPALRPLVARYGLVPPALTLLAFAAVLSLVEDRSVLPRQRVVQSGVREIFPTPVTYFDDCGLLGDFPRAISHYISGWGLENYRRRGRLSYSMAMDTEPVPLLLADAGMGTLCFDFLHRRVLLPGDHRRILDNYVPHWGSVFVAGKRIPAGNQDEAFEIAVPGIYTIEDGAITIDGRAFEPGDLVDLARGRHVASGPRTQRVTLRWGDHLPRPAYPWPEGRLFTDF